MEAFRCSEQGIKDLEAGRYEDFDANGLRALANYGSQPPAGKLPGNRKKRGTK